MKSSVYTVYGSVWDCCLICLSLTVEPSHDTQPIKSVTFKKICGGEDGNRQTSHKYPSVEGRDGWHPRLDPERNLPRSISGIWVILLTRGITSALKPLYFCADSVTSYYCHVWWHCAFTGDYFQLWIHTRLVHQQAGQKTVCCMGE